MPGQSIGRVGAPGRLLRRVPQLPLLLVLLLAASSLGYAFRLPSTTTTITRSSTGIRIRALPATPTMRMAALPMPLSGPIHPPKHGLKPLQAWPTGRDPKSFAKDFPLAAARVGITILATVLTYVAHAANKRCSPVLASAAVTLAGSLIAPGLGQVRVRLCVCLIDDRTARRTLHASSTLSPPSDKQQRRPPCAGLLRA